MTTHKTATREEWLTARLELLEAEKQLTRHSDAVAQQRQELPWVRIEKEYRFETDEGSASLADLFHGRSQLLVYHFMFGPDYKAGCPSCSGIADGFNGFVVHLANHDVMLWAVSRAPLPKLQAYKRRMEWTFPWASSFESDFNYDYGVAFTEEEQRSGVVQHNYRAMSTDSELRDEDVRAEYGTDKMTMTREAPGVSVRARGWRRLSHLLSLTQPTFAGWTASGACTSGSTARREDGTRPWCKEWETSTAAIGTAVTTNTTSTEEPQCSVGPDIKT